MESINRIDQMFGKQNGDAPRELRATIALAMSALRQDSAGEAQSELNRAHKIVNANPELTHWKAEVSAAWAVYYYHTDEEDQMLKAISYAQRLEPDNKRIAALQQALKAEG